MVCEQLLDRRLHVVVRHVLLGLQLASARVGIEGQGMATKIVRKPCLPVVPQNSSGSESALLWPRSSAGNRPELPEDDGKQLR